ncbi:MAG TPA: Rieske 2Fe-2S domain-containing protein [Symbiobacteriaceae bacterium]|nr:Rieske 2Fe-2S domain-containing protein [Symbiobacteriaceae bacterium]
MADNAKMPAGAAVPPTADAPVGQDGVTRRQMLRGSMFATIGAFFGTVAGGAGGMFWPIKLSGFGGVVNVPTPLSEIKVGDVVKVREGKFYLTRSEEGFNALYWKCVHLGCTVPFDEAQHKFACPCHGSVYDINGQNVAGPAPRPLDQMEIQITGDKISVNTGKITERTKYDPSMSTKV